MLKLKQKRITRTHLPYMTEAATIAQKSPVRYRHGAVLVDRSGKVIAAGYNRYTEKSTTLKDSVHAEIACINQLSDRRQMRGANLYVVRIGKSNELRNSQPCSKCYPKLLKAMKKHGLRNVYYSTS